MKQNPTLDSIKVCAQSKKSGIPFTLTLYDKKKRHIFKSSGISGLDVLRVPPKVFRELGPKIEYKISIP